MDIIDIHEAKTHLCRLVEQASRGEPFIITKAGRPVALVSGVDAAPRRRARRLGFLGGQVFARADFDRMHQAEIERLFGAERQSGEAESDVAPSPAARPSQP